MSFFLKAYELETKGEAFVVVTMVGHRGHAPQDTGAKAIVTHSGLVAGTVGGGKVEAKAISLAQSLLAQHLTGGTEKVVQVKWNLQKDVGMTCGGEVEFVLEVFAHSRWKIVVFGAGHIAQSLVRLLMTLECHVICLDSRQEWLDKLPDTPSRLTKHCVPNLENALEQLPNNAFYVVMTQGHATDMPILKNILSKFCPPYVGVIGSPVKSIKIRKELSDLGIQQDWIDSLNCPMGLALGSNEPAEIAISIAAQLLQKRAEIIGEDKWKNS